MTTTDKDTEIQLLKDQAVNSERRAIEYGDYLHQYVLAMRAAVVAGKLESPEVGLQWIVNTLAGPGHLPDLEEACAAGGAQAMFDAEWSEHEAFRAAHPAPAHPQIVLTQATLDVMTERRRQIEEKGWTPEHDDEHAGFELARAGACYAEYGNWPAHSEVPPNSWPWPAAWWKPSDYRRNLVKAAALILAEIERLDRIQSTGDVK